MRPKPGIVAATRIPMIVAVAILGISTLVQAQQYSRRFGPIDPHVRLAPDPFSPAGANHSWDVLVTSAQVGRRAKVALNDSTALKGEILAIDGRSITLKQPAGPRVIRSGEVTRVSYATHHSRNAFLIGVLAVSAATTVDASRNHTLSREDEFAMGPVFLGLPVGGIAAWVWRDRPLYKATKLPTTP